jgi:hypothetical protein
MVGRLRHYRCLVEAQLASHADVLRSNAGNDVLKATVALTAYAGIRPRPLSWRAGVDAIRECER